jgi:predicted NBD/HSP70 family sugar kinase
MQEWSGAISHSRMLQLNEQLVLDHVRERGRISRTEIATELGLSGATVSRAVRRLADAGLVLEEPGASTRGRRRTDVTFNERSGCVIGIDLGGTKCHGVLADLAGGVLREQVWSTDAFGDPFATLLEALRQLGSSEARGSSPLAAVAIGVPAIIDQADGVAVSGPNVHWHGFPIVAEVRSRLDVPFLIDNDVNLAALGHAWKGDARGVSDFAVVNLGTGIGAAIVADGRLLRGHGSSAGEVGYLVLDRKRLRASRDGDLGVFETEASGPALARIATSALEASDRPSVLRDGGAGPTPAEVFAAAASGDRIARHVVATMVDYVAMALVAIGAVADPEVVILDGAVGRALAASATRIQELVDRHLPTPPRVIVSTLSEGATALGAVAAALDLSRGASFQTGHPWRRRALGGRPGTSPEPRNAA